MKIIATTELTVTKTVYTADWIDAYDDGMPLSSVTHKFDSEEERKNELEKEYEPEEIDIDTDKHEYGWEYGTETQTITTTVEVIENELGKIVVRQKK